MKMTLDRPKQVAETIRRAIPFELNGRCGTLDVVYGPNDSVEASGFDLLGHLGFDVNLCIGYPVMQGTIADFGGTGYYTASAFIQVISSERRSADGVVRKSVEIDANPTLVQMGVPFFAMGYPASIYDAPCNNLGTDEHLRWRAHTYFVTMPSPINHGIISFVAGFSWGYEEWDEGGQRRVELQPLQVSDGSDWDEQLPLLRRHCPRFLLA